jgi:hypothetical protein
VTRQTISATASALLAATLAAAPAAALAQAQGQAPMQNDQTTGADASMALYMRSASRMDANTQALASLTNQIPQRNVIVVPVDGFHMSPAQHQAAMGSMNDGRRAALKAAMDKATVATVDRPNGTSEDQNSLTDYIKHLGIDPRGVVAVDVNTTKDPQNPLVTVFYHAGAMKGQQQGGPG